MEAGPADLQDRPGGEGVIGQNKPCRHANNLGQLGSLGEGLMLGVVWPQPSHLVETASDRCDPSRRPRTEGSRWKLGWRGKLGCIGMSANGRDWAWRWPRLRSEDGVRGGVGASEVHPDSGGRAGLCLTRAGLCRWLAMGRRPVGKQMRLRAEFGESEDSRQLMRRSEGDPRGKAAPGRSRGRLEGAFFAPQSSPGPHRLRGHAALLVGAQQAPGRPPSVNAFGVPGW